MCGRNYPQVKIRSDEQKSHKRPYMRVSLRRKMKPDSYTDSCTVNVVDEW